MGGVVALIETGLGCLDAFLDNDLTGRYYSGYEQDSRGYPE